MVIRFIRKREKGKEKMEEIAPVLPSLKVYYSENFHSSRGLFTENIDKIVLIVYSVQLLSTRGF
jgi:hypothetical protein